MGGNPASRVHTSMGAFGAPSHKPSMLTGNVPFIDSLKKSPTDDDRVRFSMHQVVDVDEYGSVTGRGADLKATQEYPIDYCEEVAHQWLRQNTADPISDDDESDDGLYDEN